MGLNFAGNCQAGLRISTISNRLSDHVKVVFVLDVIVIGDVPPATDAITLGLLNKWGPALSYSC